jgi:hypothetical protein
VTDLADYALPYVDLVVVFADDAANGHAGARYATHGDQRDIYRGQVAAGISDTESDLAKLQMVRAAAWAYLTRTGQVEMGWRDFDRDVAFIVPMEDQTAADPTGTATDS